VLQLAKQSLDEAPYKLSGAVAKLASITFWSLAFSWIQLNLSFLLRENLLLYSSYLSLGVPNWVVILPASHPNIPEAKSLLISPSFVPATESSPPRTMLATADVEAEEVVGKIGFHANATESPTR
jgi:hypothetical protein